MTPFKCSQEGSSVGRRVQVLAELKRIPGFEP